MHLGPRPECVLNQQDRLNHAWERSVRAVGRRQRVIWRESNHEMPLGSLRQQARLTAAGGSPQGRHRRQRRLCTTRQTAASWSADGSVLLRQERKRAHVACLQAGSPCARHSSG
jgi:hypothetical protein